MMVNINNVKKKVKILYSKKFVNDVLKSYVNKSNGTDKRR